MRKKLHYYPSGYLILQGRIDPMDQICHRRGDQKYMSASKLAMGLLLILHQAILEAVLKSLVFGQ